MWTRVWPTDLGTYWFYGWKWFDPNTKPYTMLVVVKKSSAGRLIYTTEGVCLYPNEGAHGVWMPAKTPTPGIELKRLQ